MMDLIMMAEKSLLQQIREKELMLNIKIDEARREAEEVIRNGRMEASKMIENSEREGKEAAQEYYEKEMEKLRDEIEQLKVQGDQQAMSVREEGERNLPAAKEKIIKKVSME
jgi:vacuolar-type H+-ATPase subunit H